MICIQRSGDCLLLQQPRSEKKKQATTEMSRVDFARDDSSGSEENGEVKRRQGGGVAQSSSVRVSHGSTQNLIVHQKIRLKHNRPITSCDPSQPEIRLFSRVSC